MEKRCSLMAMMTTILEALQNAQCNFETVARLGCGSNNPIYTIAMDQLKNAIEALENGMKPDDVIQENLLGDVKTKP